MTGAQPTHVRGSSTGDETTRRGGLSSAEAARRLAIHGENRIAAGRTISPVVIFGRQFQSLLVVILLVAAGLALLFGEVIDAAAITAIVVLNAGLGFVQEWRAEATIEALRDMLEPQAEVLRDGKPCIISATTIVPGDLVVLSEGQKVPADLTLEQSYGLRLDESALTGESVPVDRSATDAQANEAFMGTVVVGGRAEGRVTATGTETRFGEIAELTGFAGEKTTRLQRQMARLGRQLGLLGIVVAAAILALGLIVGRDPFQMVLTALSMAVAIVPEGLPVVVTLTLAIGASAMARRKALLRRLQSAETLGAASVICTDKTGTLTENKMTAETVVTPDHRYTVTGIGYDPAGRIERDGQAVRAADDDDLAHLLHAAQACNNARLEKIAQWQMIGDPTEGALITLAMKGWANRPDPNDRLAELPFSSERKLMGMIAPGLDGTLGYFVKGAPGAVLSACSHVRTDGQSISLDISTREDMRARYQALEEQGLRVIAIADRPAAGPHDDQVENLTLLGFVGLLDPPRQEVAGAVSLCHQAGIRVIMITGDSARTAAAIAGKTGIHHERICAGEDIPAMTDSELDHALTGGVIFARAAPADKMRIVERLQHAGAIVAMTGDGVNDAPALRRADIGLAMGQRGTDAAKEASDIVILDDNFATIVGAIAEGRRQFENIRKFVRYLLSSNSAEVLALTVNLLVGGPLILLPVHILWLNLLTDGVSAVALGLEPGEPEQMQHAPLPKDATVLTREGILRLTLFGMYMAAICLGLFYATLERGAEEARTLAFSALVACQLAAVFAFRSPLRSAWSLGIFSNPWLVAAVAAMLGLQALAVYWPPLQLALGTVPLSPAQLGVITLCTLPVLLVPTVTKAITRRRLSAAPIP